MNFNNFLLLIPILFSSTNPVLTQNNRPPYCPPGQQRMSRALPRSNQQHQFNFNRNPPIRVKTSLYYPPVQLPLPTMPPIPPFHSFTSYIPRPIPRPNCKKMLSNFGLVREPLVNKRKQLSKWHMTSNTDYESGVEYVYEYELSNPVVSQTERPCKPNQIHLDNYQNLDNLQAHPNDKRTAYTPITTFKSEKSMTTKGIQFTTPFPTQRTGPPIEHDQSTTVTSPQYFPPDPKVLSSGAETKKRTEYTLNKKSMITKAIPFTTEGTSLPIDHGQSSTMDSPHYFPPDPKLLLSRDETEKRTEYTLNEKSMITKEIPFTKTQSTGTTPTIKVPSTPNNQDISQMMSENIDEEQLIKLFSYIFKNKRGFLQTLMNNQTNNDYNTTEGLTTSSERTESTTTTTTRLSSWPSSPVTHIDWVVPSITEVNEETTEETTLPPLSLFEPVPSMPVPFKPDLLKPILPGGPGRVLPPLRPVPALPPLEPDSIISVVPEEKPTPGRVTPQIKVFEKEISANEIDLK